MTQQFINLTPGLSESVAEYIAQNVRCKVRVETETSPVKNYNFYVALRPDGVVITHFNCPDVNSVAMWTKRQYSLRLSDKYARKHMLMADPDWLDTVIADIHVWAAWMESSVAYKHYRWINELQVAIVAARLESL